MQLTAILRQDDEVVTSFCPELDVASQGDTFDEAKRNLKEAVELLLEVLPPDELKTRYMSDSYVTSLEVRVG